MLASLAMLGPFAVDTYLPSFTAIGEEFFAPPIAVQSSWRPPSPDRIG